jgi:hypothetical protein
VVLFGALLRDQGLKGLAEKILVATRTGADKFEEKVGSSHYLSSEVKNTPRCDAGRLIDHRQGRSETGPNG